MLNTKKAGLLFWGLVVALTAFACATITGETAEGTGIAGTATPNLTLTAVFAPTQEKDPILELGPLPTEDFSQEPTPTPVDVPQGDSGEPEGSVGTEDEDSPLSTMPVVEAIELLFEEPVVTGEATPAATAKATAGTTWRWTPKANWCSQSSPANAPRPTRSPWSRTSRNACKTSLHRSSPPTSTRLTAMPSWMLSATP